MCPLVSKTPQARSWLSRTIVLKAVRISASCCSLATESSRFHTTSSVTGSIPLLATGELHDDIQLIVDAAAPARADDQRRFALFHDRRSGKRRARRERVAVVDRRFDIAVALGKICAPLSFQRSAAVRFLRQAEIHRRIRSGGDHAPGDDFERGTGPFAAVEPGE